MKKRVLLGCLAALLAALPAGAAEFGGVRELYIYPAVQFFSWQEYGSGPRLLREQGPQFGVGAAVALDLLKTEQSGSFTFRGKGDFFGGVVEYNGQTFSNDPAMDGRPVKTDVTYLGMNTQVDIGWRFPVGKLSLEPFAGLGFSWWLRDLHDSTSTRSDNGNLFSVSAYTEFWTVFAGRFGGRLRVDLNDDWQIFCVGGAKFPFSVENTIDVASIGDVTLKPKGEWSAFGELGFRYRRFRPSVYYEGLRLAASPAVYGYYQPRSEADIVGLSFGILF